jgi:hypothetical protein
MTTVAAIVLGLLAVGSFWWFPTLAVLLGLLAVLTGFLARRRLATSVGGDTSLIWAHRLSFVGIALGTAALIGSIAVVVTTTG